MGVIGIDEVGRGAWAGPLCVGLVRFICGVSFEAELNDSKLVRANKRQELAALIAEQTQSAVGWVWPIEIDALGLTSATQLAIRRALESFDDVTDILIDGSVNYLTGTEWEKVSRVQVKADQAVHEVMAASIIAKVARDAYMAELELSVPGYGFKSHVGYGTKVHAKALRVGGVTEHHRRSYKPVAALL